MYRASEPSELGHHSKSRWYDVCWISGDGFTGRAPAEHRVGEAEVAVAGPAAVSRECVAA